MASHDYLKKILTARVYDVAIETELESARNLSARLRNAVYLKREDNQPVFSFKLRGAYNKMAHIPSEALARGVITASAGNHAQGVAFSAARMGVKAVIVVPVTTPQVKVDAVRTAASVEVIQAGESYSDAYAHAVKVQEERGLTFVHPFDDPYVIAGHDRDGNPAPAPPIHAIFVPIGGGGRVRRRGLREGGAPGDQGDRRAGRGFVRDGAVAGSRQACRAERGRPVRGRHRREAGRRGNLPALQRIPRRRRDGEHRRTVRGDQDVFQDTRSVLERPARSRSRARSSTRNAKASRTRRSSRSRPART